MSTSLFDTTSEAPHTAHSAYHDSQLRSAMKELRAAVQTLPRAVRACRPLNCAYGSCLKWSNPGTGHAERAETLIRLGKFEATNSTASLIFDDGLRHDLPVRLDLGAQQRILEAKAMERQVLV